ncbi:MAG: hypothetical protein KA419_01460 [Acidobacteria bacterium]|nr:hypothetical protein [Acidobacteriota bacterium]
MAEYFAILKDTLTGYELPAWRLSVKRKALSTSKFYLFDCGVVRHLQGRREIVPGTPDYGVMLETLLSHEHGILLLPVREFLVRLWEGGLTGAI